MKIDVENMKRLMVRNALTGQQLAGMVGVSTTAIYNVLNKGSVPRPTTLKGICDALNCEPDDIIKEW